VVENTFDAESVPTRPSGLGLENVRRRLESRYAAEANMRVTREEGQFQVRLSLPVENHEVSR